jgi:ferredoxin
MTEPWRLVIDPTVCDGAGVCAELLPERIDVDPWGFPLLADDEVPFELLALARRAVRSCPQLALHLVAVDHVRIDSSVRSSSLPARQPLARSTASH